MDAVISLYSPQTSPRFRWAAKVFFRCAMRAELTVYEAVEDFESAPGVRVNYSHTPIPGAFQIAPHGLLWEKEIAEQNFYTSQWAGLPIFCQRQQGDLPFDPLSATFFLAARYEEYLPFIADAHGRFPAKESFAYQHEFLDQPLINQWALQLGKEFFGANFELTPHYRYLSTIDIDNLFAYTGKGALRTIGALLGDLRTLNFAKMRERLGVLVKLRKDPYNTFRKQRNFHKSAGVESIYFMLFAGFSSHDRNVSPYSTEAAIKLREIADWSKVGIHPSYASDSDLARMSEERDRLQEVLRQPVTQSRQHYLKMRMPSTFRHLVDMGVKEEHSMGYAEVPGFRASMAAPYTFYDLELEAELPLTLFPFAFMDVTYYDYGGLGPEESLEQMLPWIDRVKSVGGTLVSVWHNRTFSEHEPVWAGWNDVYKTFIHAAQD